MSGRNLDGSIDLEALKREVGEVRRKASVYYRKQTKRDAHRVSAEAAEEEKNGGMAADDYFAKYHDPDEHEEDLTAVNMVTNLTWALIAIAERMDP